MSTIASVITDVRIEINDSDNTRFTDDVKILAIVKQAIRRANRICQRSQLHFAKKSALLDTVVGQGYVDMPADCDVPIGLWRQDLAQELEMKPEGDWEKILVAGDVSKWFFDLENSRILLKDTPQSVISLKFWYYPTIDPSAYTTASTMPWSGKLDDIIARYVALRIQNIEEQNITQDQAILQDMENSIVSVYAPLNPLMISREGWL